MYSNGRPHGGSPPQLPSIGRQNSISKPPPSASIRGQYHNKVPDIANSPLNTALPQLPDNLQHPKPYFITQNVVFKVSDGVPPWLESFKAYEVALSNAWMSKSTLRNRFLDEFIKDSLHEEISIICSEVITERQARHQGEARISKWVNRHVVTDTVYDLVEDLAWEALWDQARKLKKPQVFQLEKSYKKGPADKHMVSVIREHYSRPLNRDTGSSLVNHSWGELVYFTHLHMQRGSLAENYAIQTIQQKIVAQVAANLMLYESIRCMENEQAQMDEYQKIETPPRKVKQTS